MKYSKSFVLIISLLAISIPAYQQVIENVELKFNATNKKKYFQGENIVLDAEVINKSNQLIAICNFSSWNIYSTTYSKDLSELEDIAPIDHSKVKTFRSNRKFEKPKPITPSLGCEITNFNNIFIPPGKVSHYSLPIEVCLHDRQYCSGNFFPLPNGKYEVTLYLLLNTGEISVKTYAFEKVPAATEQEELLRTMKDIFSLGNSQHIIDFYNTCQDKSIKNKIITSIRKHTSMDNLLFTFLITNIANISDKALLIYELNETVKLLCITDQILQANYNVSRIEIYKIIYNSLKGRDPEVITAFKAIVNSWNTYKDNQKIFRVIPEEQIQELYK